jgi:hypothetical protein
MRNMTKIQSYFQALQSTEHCFEERVSIVKRAQSCLTRIFPGQMAKMMSVCQSQS